jgi:LPPG:FO 2-phospho-L-lactate transferase
LATPRITVLAGGVGAARFLEGLVQVVDPSTVTVVSNTGDDDEFFGLHVSPDIDTVIYTLAGAVDRERGWGLAGETWHALEAMRRFGEDPWFNLGDADLATHAHRSQLLRAGATLSEATASVARAFGLSVTLLPMSDDRVRTVVETDEGTLSFQEYFVRRRTEPEVRAVRFEGAEHARPAPGVIDAIAGAGAVIVAPSNPVVSIGPILAVPGVRPALAAARTRVAAVSPIVGGKALKGPADRMMASLGLAPTAAGVAAAYEDFVSTLVIDDLDRDLAPAIGAAGVRAVVAPTIMAGPAEKRALAQTVLRALQ